MVFRLWKQLKRRLRRQRRIVWTLGGALLLLFAANPVPPAHAESLKQAMQPDSIRQAADESGVEVVLRRVYVCGEETAGLGRLSADRIIALLHEHPDWSASFGGQGNMVQLEERIDDLSDYCKSHAYFGLDRSGNLSLFDGEPKNEKVLRTFFQLDVRYMESSLPPEELDQLARGIRVSDMDEYNSILSTFSDYAVGTHEKAMKQNY